MHGSSVWTWQGRASLEVEPKNPGLVSRRATLLLILALIAFAGCASPAAPAPPDDKFPEDASAGHAFRVNASGNVLALHLDVPQDGRVAYRVLAREGVKVDACLMQGHDHALWWANHSVPVKACQRDAIIAKQGATIPAGPWSIVLRAHGCPDSCTLTLAVNGATILDAAEGPLDPAALEAATLARCHVC